MLHVKSIRITPDILSLLSELDEFKGYWNALQNHTTSLNLIADVANFGKNFQALFEPLQQAPLNTDTLDKLLMVVMKSKILPEFKIKHMPLIVQREDHIIGTLDTIAPDEVEPFLQALLQWMERESSAETLHPLIRIAVFIAVFLQICPYDKGNQKLSRLMITLLMMKAGYTYAPYIHLEDIMLDSAQRYFDVLQEMQKDLEEGKANWEPWILYMLDVFQKQKRILEGRMKASSKDFSALPALSSKIMALFRDHERLQMKEIERLTRGRRSTLKLRLGELVESGYLKRHGQARSTWYSKV